MHIELHTAAREAAALQLRCRRVEDRQPGRRVGAVGL